MYVKNVSENKIEETSMSNDAEHNLSFLEPKLSWAVADPEMGAH